jgi:hypothetical protein
MLNKENRIENTLVALCEVSGEVDDWSIAQKVKGKKVENLPAGQRSLHLLWQSQRHAIT